MNAKVPTANATISPAYFSHIVFYTRRFAEMIDWYRTLLGADIMLQSERIAFLTFDDEHHRVAIIKRDDLQDRPGDAYGFAHAAWTYDSLSSLVATYERLNANGVKPVREINHGPTTSLYYEDPDGNRIELQVDNFATVADLNDWFATGAFDQNPIGIEIAFDDLCSRFHAGVAEADLLRPLTAA